MSTPFLYSEARLTESLGITREDLRPMRQLLKEGRDWKKIRGQVLLSKGSANYIARAFGNDSPDLEALLQTEALPPEVIETNGQAGRKKMRVVRPMPFNPRIVMAQEIDDPESEKVIVWVGRNETFCFDDEIEVEPHETQTGILQCVSEIPRDRRRVHRN